MTAQQNKTQPLTQLSEDERMFYQSALDFARKEIAPHVTQMDESETMNPEIIRKMHELGFMGVEVPEVYGGAGSTFFNAILIIEALAQVDPSVSVLMDVQNTLVENAFLKWGTETLRKKYLPLLTGSKVGSYCLTEPNSGSDAFALKTRAWDEGTHYHLYRVCESQTRGWLQGDHSVHC